ncbi:S2-RNase [Pyrus ussuriensis x Pyrus communis]|uniref:S2-RNase n=1 Tax=Pyrus ussuriensis x Pyrus communis TaxID=2448454 RepID=A0A5N5I9P7_9ROSA|nr:S2-RNase [Pyrus ussuriensis x Pyrus communis]
MALKIINQDVYKLDKFDGSNFTRWKDKMCFMLTVLNVIYVLDSKLEPIGEPKDELVCRGHILGTLSDRSYDLYAHIQSPKEIWEALEHKYTTEKRDQVHELLVLVSKLRELKIVILDPMIVGAIMAKLPQTWNNYRKKLLHMVKDISLEDLQKGIQIEEETRNRDKNFANQDLSKNFKVKVDKGKFKKINSNNNQKNANGVCYHCGKKCHYIRDCRHIKASEEYANKTNNANMVENSGIDNIVAMVSMMHIGMVTELNMAVAIKSSDWWLDSGATIHMCNDKAPFMTYEALTNNQEVLMGNYNSAKKGLFSLGMKRKSVAQLEYASVIGSLMYVMHCTRPDIAFAISKLSRYTSHPSTAHWKVINRIFGYLKRTVNLSLTYYEFPAVLEGYSDASWITRGAISWASKKQTCIAHSTMEFEFIALAVAGKEVEWIRNLLFEIKLWPQPMPSISLYCDSEATLSRAYNKLYNGKSRHISLRHEYVKQLITDGVINIVYVKSMHIYAYCSCFAFAWLQWRTQAEDNSGIRHIQYDLYAMVYPHFNERVTCPLDIHHTNISLVATQAPNLSLLA